MPERIVVKAVCDPEAGVWLVESSDVPGLNLEGETLEALAEKLPGAILDLLELDPATEIADRCVDAGLLQIDLSHRQLTHLRNLWGRR